MDLRARALHTFRELLNRRNVLKAQQEDAPGTFSHCLSADDEALQTMVLEMRQAGVLR
jgi:hypothetical protein